MYVESKHKYYAIFTSVQTQGSASFMSQDFFLMLTSTMKHFFTLRNSGNYFLILNWSKSDADASLSTKHYRVNMMQIPKNIGIKNSENFILILMKNYDRHLWTAILKVL